MEVTPAGLACFFEVVLPHMNEVQRRVVAGAAAEMFGRGGKAAVATASGMSRNTVIKAHELANPAGLTATQWQVLGAALTKPLTHAEIGRQMGITRQSVHRTAKLLVSNGLADYEPNPAHRNAPLLTPTAAGREAVGHIEPQHRTAADQVAETLVLDSSERIVTSLTELIAALERLDASRPERSTTE